MPRHEEPARTAIGKLIDAEREKRGWSLETFSQIFREKYGNQAPAYRTILNWRRSIDSACQRHFWQPISEILDIPESKIKVAAGSSIKEYELFLTNPCPYATGSYRFWRVFRMCGEYTTPLHMATAYTHTHIDLPEELKGGLFDEVVDRARERARLSGARFYDGPNTRLVGFDENRSAHFGPAEERRVITLHLAPVSWFEFTVCNVYMDEITLPGGQTIRDRYADQQRLFSNPSDLRWCQLGCVFDVAMIPITTDGFGAVQLRSRTSNSVMQNRYTSGVAECIHRFKDEAPPDNLECRLHPLRQEYDELKNEDAREYRPVGLSPLLTAQRGVHEEFSLELAERLPLSAYKFLNVCWSFNQFLPTLIGVVETGMSREDLELCIAQSPGIDEENIVFRYLPLDHKALDTKELLDNADERWVIEGLASFVTAINYYQHSLRFR